MKKIIDKNLDKVLINKVKKILRYLEFVLVFKFYFRQVMSMVIMKV